MNARTAPPMDKATFWRWLSRQERRHELVDGIPRMQPFVTRSHDRICTNVVETLLASLDRGVWDISTGDFAIETGDRSIRFADVMVHPFVADDPQGRSTIEASLLVEVLSESTAHVDFGAKLAEYTGLEGVGAYIVCAQDKACVWCWVRQPDGSWPGEPDILEGLDASVALPGLGIALPLAAIYRRVSLR